MRKTLTNCVWVLAIAAGIGVGGATLQAQDRGQDHGNNKTDQQAVVQVDYSKNKTYQQGMREGHGDYARNLDHSRKRHFKKDEDQKAYEAGYQHGHAK